MTTPFFSAIEETVTHTFETRDEAWRFMEKCDNEGIKAGYPSLKAPYTVKTLRYSADLASDLKETK